MCYITVRRRLLHRDHLEPPHAISPAIEYTVTPSHVTSCQLSPSWAWDNDPTVVKEKLVFKR